MCVLITIFSGFVASIFPWKVGILLDIVTQQNEDNNLHETSKINLIFNMIQLQIESNQTRVKEVAATDIPKKYDFKNISIKIRNGFTIINIFYLHQK